MLYSVTRAFVWDEGFHLLAAQLIQAGKRPYLDFCFPQTPLNAYWNAFWMSLFGDSWRVSHVVATLLVSGTLFATAYWLLDIFRESRWRTECATIGVLLLGANLTVFQFGGIGQAYAICMFSGFVALLLFSQRTALRIFGSGIFTGIGAASSLLIAPLAPVLFVAIALSKEHRLRNFVFYTAGCIIPFAPVLWLLSQDPHLTFFNVVQYQALFRRANWGNAMEHDADVLTSWVDNGSSLLLSLFFLAGTIWTWRQRRERPQLALCLAVSAAIILYISTAHPTFGRYYIVGAPFYAAIATAGFLWFAERLFPRANPVWPTLILAGILVLEAGRFVYKDRDATTWKQYENIAAKIASVTPHQALVFADEPVYFLLHWIPPAGLEFSYARKLSFPAAQERRLHIISEGELQQQTAAHRFAVFQTCKDEIMDNWHLDNVYRHRQDFDDCSVFW